MSTRANIIFRDCEGLVASIYQHWDGYPSAVLPVLADFVSSFVDKRGPDVTYMAARALVALMRANNSLGKDDVTGFGLSSRLFSSCSYTYIVEVSDAGVVYIFVESAGTPLVSEQEAFNLAKGHVPERFQGD